MASLVWSNAAYASTVELLGETYNETDTKARWDEIQKGIDARVTSHDYGNDHEMRMAFNASRKAMDIIVRTDTGSGIHEAFESMLKSVVIQVWAAYETLAADLWESASTESSKSLRVPTDAEWKKERLGFISRRRIEDTYDFLFPVDNAEIQKSTRGEDIDALALTRNVLVHSAGVVDEDFEQLGKSVPLIAGLASLGRDVRIPFDGELVMKLVNPVIRKGYKLLENVENWLDNHP